MSGGTRRSKNLKTSCERIQSDWKSVIRQNQPCESELLFYGRRTDDSQSRKIFEDVREVKHNFYFTSQEFLERAERKKLVDVLRKEKKRRTGQIQFHQQGGRLQPRIQPRERTAYPDTEGAD